MQKEMKRFHIIFLLSGIAYTLFLYFVYPATLTHIEDNDLFLMNSVFIKDVLSRSQGVTFLLLDFIEQFFSSALTAAIICALIVVASSEFIFLAILQNSRSSKTMAGKSSAAVAGCERKSYAAVLAAVPAPVIMAFTLPFIDFSLYFMFFTLLVFVFTAIKSDVWRCVYAFLLPVPAFCLMPWIYVSLLYVTFIAIELVCQRRHIVSALLLLPLAASFFVPRLWSEWFDFVGPELRPFSFNGNIFSVKVFSMYLVAAFAVVAPWNVKLPKVLDCSLAALPVLFFVVVLGSNKEMLLGERITKISNLADKKDWEGIIAEIPYEDAVKSQLLMRYTLLALNATGSLGESIFSYPINSPDMFLFRHKNVPVYNNFNRQFYDNIGIWNEAYHESFEYGVTQRENDCFKAMRDKTDYAMNSGDLGGAEYYLHLLEQSCNNRSFVKNRRERLNGMKAERGASPLARLPYRSDTFVGAYPIASEMIRLYERNPKSRKLFDYVLCSLLLTKEVGKFGIVYKHFLPNFDFQSIPRNYAEALAVVATRDTSVRSIPGYDRNMEKYYADFVGRLKSQGDISEYSLTFWAYLHFRRMAPPEAPSD